MAQKSELKTAKNLFAKIAEAANINQIEPNQPRVEIAKALGMDLEKSGPWKMLDFEAHLAAGMLRDLHIKDYGFTLLSRECLDVLEGVLKGKRCLDAGAGTGYLAHQLTQRGVDVTASEKFVSGNGYGFKKMWQNDHSGDTSDILPGDFDAVLLAWPPYQGEFGLEVVSRLSRGQLLVYQGEGMGGCTGTDEMHDALSDESSWTPLPDVSKKLNTVHLQFPGIHDRWYVYRKK